MNHINVLTKIIEEIGSDYFSEGTDIYFTVKGEESKIVSLEGIFEDDVSEQAVCMKLYHNMSMVRSFSANYPVSDKNWSWESMRFNARDNLDLVLHIDTGNVEIKSKNGYGTIFMNHRKMLMSLWEIPHATKTFLKLYIEKHDAQFLNKVIDFDRTMFESNASVDEVMNAFVLENAEFFEILIVI